MKTDTAKKYKIVGYTYNIRIYLSLCGCIWNGVFWSTDDKELKTRLRKMNVCEKMISKLKLEKIS